MRISVIAITTALGVLVAATSSEAETVYTDIYLTVGRYSSYSTAPEFDQINLLAQLVTVEIPQDHIRTIGQAIQHLLHGSGYSQAASHDRQAVALMHKPLPEVHRQLGPMPLAVALKTLVGQSYEIQINNVQRNIRVDLKKAVEPKTISKLPDATFANAEWDTNRVRR